MVWNKTPQEIVDKVLIALEDVEKDYKQIAQELEVSEWIVGDICRTILNKDTRKKRYSAACRRGKLGSKNPMYGKKGFAHHNSQDVVRVMGYKTVFTPDWWTGNLVKSGRIYEHHYVWALANGVTDVPDKHVIHHCDCNIDNNTPGNLLCMTISDHMKLHSKIRKEQRLERKLVGNSVPEAHSPEESGDDIV